MSETARSDRANPFAGDVAPAVGTVLSGVAMVATLVPVRRGVTDPVVLATVAFAVVAVVAFVARRHGGIGRTIGAAVAATASAVVLLLSAYVLNQGVEGPVALPVVAGSIPLVFVGFLAAGGAISAAVADFFALDAAGLKRRSGATAFLAVIGVVGLLVTYLWTTVIAVPAYVVAGEVTSTQLMVISQLGMAFGMGTVAAVYIWWTDRDLAFVDLRVPSLRDVGWVVGGCLALFGALIAISILMTLTGVESASHGTTERAAENPEILLVLIPASILVIGPFEELLYRNVVQKSLYETFSRYGAVLVASVIFAGVHVLAYGTAGPGAVLASLGLIFGLSLVLGTVYERTNNLLVPALIHGLYNAIQFANLYFSYA